MLLVLPSKITILVVLPPWINLNVAWTNTSLNPKFWWISIPSIIDSFKALRQIRRDDAIKARQPANSNQNRPLLMNEVADNLRGGGKTAGPLSVASCIVQSSALESSQLKLIVPLRPAQSELQGNFGRRRFHCNSGCERINQLIKATRLFELYDVLNLQRLKHSNGAFIALILLSVD